MMLVGYIESELQSAMSFAKPGDDVLALLLVMGAHPAACERTHMVRMQHGRPCRARKAPREYMLRATMSESCVDASLNAHLGHGDADGLIRALSQVRSLATPLDAWKALCTVFGVRSVKRPWYIEAVRTMSTVPGFAGLRPVDESIEAHLDALEDLNVVPF